MTLPSVIRVFFAINLPTSVSEQVGRFIGLLKRASNAQPISWVKPQNLHITLQFLAQVKTADLPEIINHVRTEVTGSYQPMTLRFGGLRLFPNAKRPRVIVMDIAPEDKLVFLSERIGKGIKAAHYEIESRSFQGHLTLGRIRRPYGVDLTFLSRCPIPTIKPLDVSDVVLFRSERQAEGSKYIELERIGLKA